VIREGRRRGEASVRERAWRRSSDAMGGGGGQRGDSYAPTRSERTPAPHTL
jgi:hypothetical protein